MERNKDETVSETAAAWDARLRSPDCTDVDREQFATWRDADPSHRRTIDNLQILLSGIRAKKSHPGLRRLRDSALAMAKRRQTRLNRSIAAALILLTAGGLLWTTHPKWTGLIFNPADIYATGTGQRTTVTLQDGSTLDLNSQTRVKVAFNDAQRAVYLLQGQAFFHVAKNPARPFVVHAGNREITAVGTSFDVSLEKSAVRVTLVEGKISVTPDATDLTSNTTLAEPVFLTAGQQFVAARNSTEKSATMPEAREPQIVREIDTAKVTGWRDGRIFLQDLTLADAVAEMNKHSPVQIALIDPEIKDLRVNGMFRAGEQQAFVTALESYFPITAEARSDIEIVLKRR